MVSLVSRYLGGKDRVLKDATFDRGAISVDVVVVDVASVRRGPRRAHRIREIRGLLPNVTDSFLMRTTLRTLRGLCICRDAAGEVSEHGRNRGR